MMLNSIHEFKINVHNLLLRKYYTILAELFRIIQYMFEVYYIDIYSHREMKKKN